VADAALESAMALSTSSPSAGSMAEREPLSDEQGKTRSVFNQLQWTRQWEADGTHLLRPAAYHAWAAPGCAVTQ
jgi:hypothetical protein